MVQTTEIHVTDTVVREDLASLRPTNLKILITAGQFQGVDPLIYNFEIRKFPRKLKYRLNCFPKPVPVKEGRSLIAEQDYLGRLEHLLIMASLCTGLQREFPIISPGSSLKDPEGNEWTPCLTFSEKKRFLRLVTFEDKMWSLPYRFLSVYK